MRWILIVFLFIVVLVPSSSANGQVGHGIQFTPCIASNGTYQVGVRAIIAGGASLELEHWFNTGGMVNDGFVSNGWTTWHTGIVEYSQLHYRYIGDLGFFAAAFVGTNYPACPEDPKVAEPIFPMWLLTKRDSYCIMISEFHPSVESQKRLCFPGQEWVADHAI